jgi:hypothetical protein
MWCNCTKGSQVKKHILFNSFLMLASMVFGQTIPVDKLTGKLAVTVPIIEATSGSLSVPIYLSYSGGGIKVSDIDGTAGLGWNLVAGGEVVRELRSLPDDYQGSGADTRKGWRVSPNAAEVNNTDFPSSTCAEETSAFNFIASRGYTKDTEPDLFTFRAPGLSGQFVFDATGQPKLIPYQDLKITFSVSTTNTIESFTVTTNQGIAYNFSGKQNTKRQAVKLSSSDPEPKYFRTNYEYFKTPLAFTTAWVLSTMTAPDGSYISLGYTSPTPKRQENIVATFDEANNSTNQYKIVDETNYLLVNQIRSPLTSVNFAWDIKDSNLIQSIKIKENVLSTEKNYYFNYLSGYDSSAPTALMATVEHAFLNSVTQERQCITYPSFAFSYYGTEFIAADPANGLPAYYKVSLPFFKGKRKDYWGYANATADATTEAPTIYATGNTDAERYRISPLTTGGSQILGGNRNPTPTASIVSAASLKQISYPTGAKATIEYEPNSYWDDATASTQLGGGIRVSRTIISDIEHDAPDLITFYEYTQPNGSTSGRLVYRPVFTFEDGVNRIRSESNLGPEDEILYSKVAAETVGRGKTVCDYLVPAMYSAVLPTAPDWAATKSKIARLACESPGNQVSGYYSYPFPPNTNYSFERGLPQAISDYSEAGTLLLKREFNYERLPSGASPVVKIKGLRFEKQANGTFTNYLFGHYTLIANTDKVVVKETTTRADEITPENKMVTTTNYVYSNVHSLLESINTAQSTSTVATENIIYKTTYRYAKDFMALLGTPSLSDPETAGINSLNSAAVFRSGTLIETIQTRSEGTLGNNEKVISASLTTFKDFSGKVLPSRSLSLSQVDGFPLTGTGAAGNPSKIVINEALYVPTSTVKSYSGQGLPTSLVDHRGNKTGIHYGYSDQMPVASINNAYAEEVVYSGFETGSTQSLSFDAASSLTFAPEVWAGKLALSIIPRAVLSRQNITRGSDRYKASCWLKSAGPAIITFKVTGQTVVSVAVDYGASGFNQWKYLSADIAMPLGSTFALEVSSSLAAVIDEVRFQPYESDVTTTSYDLLFGKNAQVDNRGEAIFTEYDVLGRPHLIRNKNKDIVQIKEYRFKVEAKPFLDSDFTPSSNFNMQQSTELVSATNCIGGGQTYQWFANGVSIGRGTLTSAGDKNYIYYTPTSTGSLTIKLIVTHPSGVYSETEKVYCAGYPLLTMSVTVTDDNPTASATSYSLCIGGNKTFRATATGGCTAALAYTWTYTVDGIADASGNLEIFQLGSGTSAYIQGHAGTSSSPRGANGLSYTVYCTVTQSCLGTEPCREVTMRADENIGIVRKIIAGERCQ